MYKILLVEDEPWLAELYQHSLESDFEVSVATSADEALAKLDDEDINLILLDMFLPDHNGLEFLHEIASYNDTAEIPIIILSAVHPRDFRLKKQRWHHYGIVDYLYKPSVTPEKVKEVVTDQLSIAKARK